MCLKREQWSCHEGQTHTRQRGCLPGRAGEGEAAAAAATTGASRRAKTAHRTSNHRPLRSIFRSNEDASIANALPNALAVTASPLLAQRLHVSAFALQARLLRCKRGFCTDHMLRAAEFEAEFEEFGEQLVGRLVPAGRGSSISLRREMCTAVHCSPLWRVHPLWRL